MSFVPVLSSSPSLLSPSTVVLLKDTSLVTVMVVALLVCRQLTMYQLGDRLIQAYLPFAHLQKDEIKLFKYRESLWRLVIHVFTVMVGLVALCREAYFWDTVQLWEHYPSHELSSALYWYVMLELSYYVSEVLTHLATPPSRKDSWPMLLHHVTTILLIVSSYYLSFFRVGSLVMFYHDLMDPFLEGAKVASYLGIVFVKNVCFGALTLSYVSTRLLLFPFSIMRSTLYESHQYVTNNSYYFFANTLLLILFGLNIMWAVFLFKAIVKALEGKGLKDTRSDDEASSD